MAYHPRIESKEYAGFTTTRCKNSELWFINNKKLEEKVLAFTAKYSEMCNVKIYALAIAGSHLHFLAEFPDENCSDFKRNLNSIIARIASECCIEFNQRKFWERRYSKELVPLDPEDLEEYFFYIVLQSVQDGLVEKISDYPVYNCFHDAISGNKREFKLVNWTAYNRANRGKKKVKIKDYTETYTLKFSKLPGNEHLNHKEYKKKMLAKLEEKRQAIVKERKKEGKGFLGRKKILGTKPGSRAKNPKKSSRYSHRPRVLSKCPERRQTGNAYYFSKQDHFKKASKKYREGNLTVEFPCGMYRPHLPYPIRNKINKQNSPPPEMVNL